MQENEQYLYIYVNLEKEKKTTLLARQACFMIALSLGDRLKREQMYSAIFFLVKGCVW